MLTIKDKIDELEKKQEARPELKDLMLGLDNYILLKEELGLNFDESFSKYKGYKLLVDTEDESASPKFISKAL